METLLGGDICLLAFEMYLVSGSCLVLAVSVSANDSNAGAVE
jgi:hypothetical protein